MNLSKLFELQENLDEHIKEKHNLYGQSLLSKKILALQVELAELANETRCFKFWSDKKPSNKEVILEEYVDCLHFILTLGLEKGFTDVQLDNKEPIQYDVTSQFLNLYIDINDFVTCSSRDQYITLFEDFITLGKMLSFMPSEIEEAYYKKNDVNHKRQVEGY
ncbi:dUTP diphosphatase [Clostridium sp. CX1]|uniref:dUTP diphosphatase n=1 Tax=Clostridium tanneri TaxID=3037988 RepID=A0ABU4JTY6_9CLOT|nr:MULTISPECIES: dUTP diphosphatase [unclassified Clostridium]MCT8977558.1 dUTP diphosphatase [Clostridium sp. CX1]MDW8801603.1 dUTP diphosphatase [Clostridium sp. A1-XYC3]